ncbi:MAG: hypothetical protein HY892_20030 [Deltaproteobacteria bacterium]|nr:hypothetical protein [Deltaproteobacteria bacterium]
MGAFTLNGWVCQTALLAGLFLSQPSWSAAQSSQGYILKAHTLSGGGKLTTSTHYRLISTLSQPAPIGICSNNRYTNYSGFWFTVQLQRMVFLPLILRE